MPASFLKISLCSMQVCVPEDWSDEQIEQFSNISWPTGIQHRWKVRKDPELLDGDPERNPCSDKGRMVHVMLDC